MVVVMEMDSSTRGVIERAETSQEATQVCRWQIYSIRDYSLLKLKMVQCIPMASTFFCSFQRSLIRTLSM